MKRFQLISILILFISFTGVQSVVGQTQEGNDWYIADAIGPHNLGGSDSRTITPEYPMKSVYFEAYLSDNVTTDHKISVLGETWNLNTDRPENWLGIEQAGNDPTSDDPIKKTKIISPVSSSAIIFTASRDWKGNKSIFVQKIRTYIATHTKLTTTSLSFNTSIANADGETQTISLYSFLTGANGMTISIVDADGNPTDIEGQVELVGTPGYEANKLGKINEESFQIKFKPTKIVNATCSIKIENPGAEVNPTLYIPVTLKSSLPAPTLNCDAFGYTFAKLSWNAIQDAESYSVYDNGIKVENNITFNGTTATITGLNYNSSHSYTITSVVGSAESNKSEAVIVNCPAYPQVQNVQFADVQQTQVTVNWNPTTNLPENHSVVQYHVRLYQPNTGGTLIKEITTTETSYTFTGLIDNTQYTACVDVEYQYTLNGETKNVGPDGNHWSSASVTTTSFITGDPFDGALMYKGTWYRVNLNSDIDISSNTAATAKEKVYTMSLNYPCEPKVDFQINTTAFGIIYGTANIKIDESKTGKWNDTKRIHADSYSGENKAGTTQTSGHDVKALQFYCDGGANSDEYVHDIWLTIAPHILLQSNKYTTITTETATQTTEAVIDFGIVEIGDSKPINIDFKSFLSKGEVKAQLTDTTDSDVFWLNSVRGTKEHHIADNNTLEKINTNDNNFTISFNPTAAGDYDGAIIIKDNQHTVILRLKATCIKRTPEISWINDKYISLGEILPNAASSTYGDLKYESLNSDIIEINENMLESKTLGSAQIIAIIEENDTWYGAKDTATFNVTDKVIQTIEWDQDFTTLTTTAQISDAELALTAKAINRITGEENGNKIAYSTTDSTESVIKIIDGKLQIVGPGFTYITAHQQGNDEYAPTYMTKLVFVRKLANGCADILALDHAGESYGDWTQGFNWGPYSFTANLTTIGDDITFKTAKTWNLLGTLDTTGDEIIVSDDLGNIIYSSTLSDTEDEIKEHKIENKISRDARTLTFTLKGNFEVSISDIKVTPATFIETNENVINFTSTEVDLNAIKEIDFDWANQPDYAWATIIDDPNGVFSVDSETAIFGSPTCGDYGTSTVKVIFSPKKETDYTAKLAIYVGEDTTTPELIIPITGKGAKAKQEIYWLNYALTTADKEVKIANTTASSPQPITYTILAGNDVAVVNGNNTITILDEGKFTLRAVQEGNESYLATGTIEKEFTTNIGNLIFDNKKADNNWNTAGNWKPDSRLNLRRNITVEENINLSIKAPLIINNNSEIVTEKEISLSANGKITIAPQGKLKANIINGSTTNNVILQANDKGSAILVYKNAADNKVNASVQLYSIASSDGLRNGQAGNFKDPKWQYFGIVTENTSFSSINPNGTSNWIYRWDETTNATSCWAEKLSNSSTLSAWTGYCLAQESATTYNYSGALVNGDHTYPLTYTPENASADLGNNLLTNSYTAPIDITTISDANFTNAEANIYLYNTGSYLEWKHQTELEGFNPGQVIVIPVNTISALGNEYPRTIASAQAFFVKATAKNASFSVDYENNVYGSDRKENVMRARKSSDWADESNETFNSLKIQVASETSNDRLYLLEHENTTAEFDNGYDAEKIFDNPNGPQIYASTAFGSTSINTDKSFDGQYIGFVANNENELYSLTFNIENLHSYEQLWLYDTETDLYVDIINEEKYQFYGSTTPNNNRFYITSVNPNAPEIDNTPTNIETTWEEILTEGEPIYLYTTTGQLIATLNSQFSILNSQFSTLNSQLPTLNSQLPTGIYIVKSGNKTMKLRIIK